MFDMIGTLTTQPHLISVILSNILVNKEPQETQRSMNYTRLIRYRKMSFGRNRGV